MTTPEIQKPEPIIPQPAEKVEPEKPETVPEMGETVAKPQVIQTPPSATDDAGGASIQTVKAKAVTVTLPASIQQLDDWSKGDPQNALTWFAAFWLRLIKRAIHFGWKIVMKGKELINA